MPMFNVKNLFVKVNP